MLIDQVSPRIFALRMEPGSLEPTSKPLVDSLLRVYRCQAGFLIEHVWGELMYGGYYVFAYRSGTRNVNETDSILRNKEIVVFNTPNRVTLVTCPIAPELIQTILDEQ